MQADRMAGIMPMTKGIRTRVTGSRGAVRPTRFSDGTTSPSVSERSNPLHHRNRVRPSSPAATSGQSARECAGASATEHSKAHGHGKGQTRISPSIHYHHQHDRGRGRTRQNERASSTGISHSPRTHTQEQRKRKETAPHASRTALIRGRRDHRTDGCFDASTRDAAHSMDTSRTAGGHEKGGGGKGAAPSLEEMVFPFLGETTCII